MSPFLRLTFSLLRGAVALAITAATTVAAHAQTPALTLKEAVGIAAQRSASAAAADAQERAAAEMAVAAGELPDPVLKLGINNVPTSGADQWSTTRDFMTMRSVGLMQEWTGRDKRDARTERAQRDIQLAGAMGVMARTTAQREAAVAWIERYYLEAMREALGREAIEVERQAEAAQVLYRGGRGMQSDVFAMRAEVARLEDRRDDLKRRIATAKVRLARWVGPDAARPLAPMRSLDDPGLQDSALIERLREHPKLDVYARREEVADAEVRLARLNKRPDWTVELMYGQRGQDYSDMVSVNVAIPLQWNSRDRQDRELAAKLAMLDEARAQRLEAERAHVAEVQSLMDAWESGQARLVRYRESIRPLDAQRIQAALAAFRSGQGSLGQLMEARRAAVQTELEQLELERDTATSWAQLRYLNLDGSARGALSDTHIEAQQ